MRPQRRRKPPPAPVNQFIRANKLTVISSSGEKLGTYSKDEAINLAKNEGLDLLQITFDKEPCVAKIIDMGSINLIKRRNSQRPKKIKRKLSRKR